MLQGGFKKLFLMAPRTPLTFKIGLHYFFPLLLVLLLGLLALSSFILCCSEPSISDGTGVNTTGQTGTVTGFVLGSVNIRWILIQRKGELRTKKTEMKHQGEEEKNRKEQLETSFEATIQLKQRSAC